MPCDCGVSESCPSCECTINLRRPRCKVNRDCVITVADDVSISYLGPKKLYIIRLLVKNCTHEILNNFQISLDLKCALVDTPTICAVDDQEKPIDNCLGIMTLNEKNTCALLQDLCIQAAPYRVNSLYDGVNNISLLDQKSHCGNIRFPPGESAFTVRFITSASASLVSPTVTISLTVPCCGPLRKVILLKADCPPSILDKNCAVFLQCE